MSPEKHQENENIFKPESPESALNIAKMLREEYNSRILHGDTLQLPPFSKSLEMMSCSNPQDGVNQQLRALVRAGQEFFGIVESTVIITLPGEPKPYITESTLLTRHNAGGRAEIISVLKRDKDVKRIGRSHQKDLELGDRVSGHHFYLEQEIDGRINISDGDSSGKPSTNGTEVFEGAKEIPSGFYIGETETWHDFDFWSAKSSEVKKQILKSIF